MNAICRRTFVGILSMLLSFAAWGEVLKGLSQGDLVAEGAPVAFRLDEWLTVSLPASSRFAKAVELELVIPRELLPFRSGIAVAVYQGYTAAKGKEPATAERFALEALPPTGKFYLLAPLVARAGLRAQVDTAVLKIPLFEKAFPLVLSVAAIDRGLSPDLQKLVLTARARLVNANLGAINVVVPGMSAEERRKVRLSANGVLQAPESPLLLEPGLYTLTASLDGWTTVTANVAVDQAHVAEISLPMQQQLPVVMIDAPEGSQVLLDGTKVLWTPLSELPVAPGVHQVEVTWGNAMVSQTFEVSGGGVYRIRLKLQISVESE